MQDLFDDFVARYEGPKLAFIVTGGGIGIHQLAQTLGASKLLHAIHVPYSYEESARFIREAWRAFPNKGVELGEKYKEKAVSKKGAELLAQAGSIIWPECRVISCSAATTTNRYRRGDNQAFIAKLEPTPNSINSARHHHLKLTKISEEDFKLMGLGYASWKRKDEDRQITRFLLKLALGEV